MLLQPQQAVDLCLKPAYAADLDAGRALERRHRLHLDGAKGDLTAFLTEKKPGLLASPEAFQTMLTVQTPASATLFGSLIPVLDKVFTAQGGTQYFEFSDPAYADDFQAYLNDTTKTGQTVAERFASIWKRESLVGFQGIFLVDLLPVDEATVDGITGVPLGAPEPTFQYVPSSRVRDLRATGNRIEYLILESIDANQLTEYYCWDDVYCHRVQSIDGAYTYIEALRTEHGLPYVPAFFVTTKMPDATRPVLRTSAIEKALPVADEYLLDRNWVRLGSAYHANPKMWSYGVPCDYVPYLSQQQLLDGYVAVSCQTGSGYVGIDGQPLGVCPQCSGQRRYIPTGPDKTYIIEPPQKDEVSLVNPGPAGYVVPDLTSLEFLSAGCEKAEVRIEKAVLGKAGVLDLVTKAESGIAKQAELGPLEDRLNDRGLDSITVEKAICDAMARLRYGVENFKASAMARGKRYHFYTEQAKQAEFDEAKKGGADAGYLYSLLEDVLYAKYGDDPMELQRNLLKLELTPMPHLTSQEALALGYVPVADLLQKSYLNNFIARFERENGSILDFGSQVSHQKKIDAIQAQLTVYVNEKLGAPLPAVVPGRYTTDPGGVDPTAAGATTVSANQLAGGGTTGAGKAPATGAE